MMVISFYGWATSKGTSRHEATSALIEAAITEARSWPHMPLVVLGDLNASTSQIPALDWALKA
eukprot:13087990-Alexandrium_andersonii.AAC.1